MDILIETIEGLPNWGLYIFFFFSSIIENIFPPWPGDTLTVFGGFLIAKREGSFAISLLSLTLGNILAATFMYFMGSKVIYFFHYCHQKIKFTFIKNMIKPLIDKANIKKAKHWFSKWSTLLVLFSRFSAGIRFFISIIAGMTTMSYFYFFLLFTIGVLIWNILLLWAAWFLEGNWAIALDYIKIYNTFIIFCIAILVSFYFLFKRRNSK